MLKHMYWEMYWEMFASKLIQAASYTQKIFRIFHSIQCNSHVHFHSENLDTSLVIRPAPPPLLQYAKTCDVCHRSRGKIQQAVTLQFYISDQKLVAEKAYEQGYVHTTKQMGTCTF